MKRLKDYNEYLLDLVVEAIVTKVAPLYFSPRFKNIIKSIKHPISDRLLSAESGPSEYKQTYIDLDDKDIDQISYIISTKAIEILQKSLEKEVLSNSDFWRAKENKELRDKLYSNNRTVTSIGKLIVKLFPKEFEVGGTPDSIQTFVDKFKSKRSEKSEEGIVLVKDNDIMKWYDQENYLLDGTNNEQRGSIWNSCMRYSKCNDYIQFYSDNSDKVSLMILKVLDEEGEEKIKGRALVWKLDEPSGRTFMDRIYTIDTYDEELFKNYAKEQGWLYKRNQNYKPGEYIVDTMDKDNVSTKTLIIRNIKKSSTDEYPYTDTFKYYNAELGILTNDSDYIRYDNYWELNDTSGEYSEHTYDEDGDENENGIFVEFYDQRYSEEELTWCEYGHDWRLSHDATYLHDVNEYATEDYVENNMTYSSIEREYIFNDDAIYSEFHKDDIRIDTAIAVCKKYSSENESPDDIDRDEAKDDYVIDSADYYIPYYTREGRRLNFLIDLDGENFYEAYSLKKNEKVYYHIEWDKDRIFTYNDRLYLNDDQVKYDKLVGQKRIWDDDSDEFHADVE